MLFSSGRVQVNKEGRDLIEKLSKENQGLKLFLNCVTEFDGKVKFKLLTPCGCVDAELMHRDCLIESLVKENGILRKANLFKSKR